MSVPSSGLYEGHGHDVNSQHSAVAHIKLQSAANGGGPRNMSQNSAMQRPSTAGPPTQDARNGILVTKNAQRAPSANSEQSRHASKMAEQQRASSQGSQ